MNTGFSCWAADHADGLARALAGAGVGLGSLTADGQSTKVADAAIALDALEPFEIHADFAAQIAFDDILAVLDRVNDLGELRLSQVLGANAGINFRFGEDFDGVCRANAVDVTQRNVDALIGRNFNADDTSHK